MSAWFQAAPDAPARGAGHAVLERRAEHLLDGAGQQPEVGGGRTGPQQAPALVCPDALQGQLRDRWLFPWPRPHAPEGMLAFHQQLVQVDGQREQVAGRVPERPGPVRVEQLRRRELRAAHPAEERLAAGCRELHRVAVDEGDPSLRRDQDVALVEVADDRAGLVQDARGVGQVRRGVNQVPPGEAAHPGSLPGRGAPVRRVGDAVQLDAAGRVHGGHEEAGEPAVLKHDLAGPGEGHVPAGGLPPLGGRVGHQGAQLLVQ